MFKKSDTALINEHNGLFPDSTLGLEIRKGYKVAQVSFGICHILDQIGKC